jgi:hypothetical protein
MKRSTAWTWLCFEASPNLHVGPLQLAAWRLTLFPNTYARQQLHLTNVRPIIRHPRVSLITNTAPRPSAGALKKPDTGLSVDSKTTHEQSSKINCDSTLSRSSPATISRMALFACACVGETFRRGRDIHNTLVTAAHSAPLSRTTANTIHGRTSAMQKFCVEDTEDS